MNHLDPLEMDAARFGPAPAHLESCAECRAGVDQLKLLAIRLMPAPILIPESVDRAILGNTQRRRRGLWLSSLAAAAAILLVIGLLRPAPRPLDIVDALQLAKQIRSGGAIERRWDLTGDGKVDQDDVTEIARRSVAIR